MKFIECPISGLVVIEPTVFGDERGYFFESYNQEKFIEHGLDLSFVQDNQSMSHKGTLRGLHFQKPPHAQGKLVRVLQGAVLDVAVDIRTSSPTYGQHHKEILSAENNKMFWIPEGFAHGFLCLENDTVFSYKCTGLYQPSSEGGLMWNDTDLKIDWDLSSSPILSPKDELHGSFDLFESPFE